MRLAEKLDAFLADIRSHYHRSLLIGTAYMVALMVCQIKLGWAEWITALLALPLNVVSWPLAVEAHKGRSTLDRRWTTLLVVISTGMPLALLFGWL